MDQLDELRQWSQTEIDGMVSLINSCVKDLCGDKNTRNITLKLLEDVLLRLLGWMMTKQL